MSYYNTTYNFVIAGNLDGSASSAVQSGINYMTQFKSVVDETTKSCQSLKAAAPWGTLGTGFPSQGGAAPTMDYTPAISSLSRMMFTVQMSTFYLGMLTSAQGRNENSLLQIENAQMRYNRAVREHGRNSEQARAALNQLTIAQNTYRQTAAQSQMMTISLGINFAQMGMSALMTMPKLAAMKLSIDSLSTSFKGLMASIGPIGWGLLALSTIVPIGMVGMSLMNQPAPPSTNVNVSVDSGSDVIQDYLRRTGANSINSTR